MSTFTFQLEVLAISLTVWKPEDPNLLRKHQHLFQKLAAQGEFTCHSVKHGYSIRSNDKSSKLISFIFNSTFSRACIKNEVIAVTRLAPLTEEALCIQLNEASFISVTWDASKGKLANFSNGLIFHQIYATKDKLLEVHFVQGKTSHFQMLIYKFCLKIQYWI